LKALIGTLTTQGCRALASRALDAESADAVRALTLQQVPGVMS
jgi:hypothetical protein